MSVTRDRNGAPVQADGSTPWARIERLEAEAFERIGRAATEQELEAARVAYLGKKGELTLILRGMGQIDPAQRPRIGQQVNAARDRLEQALAERQRALADRRLAEQLAAEAVDVTLPARRPARGHWHPIRRVLADVTDYFVGLGFRVVEGPEVETDYYNFEALNIPQDHPARDMWDTFYITDDLLLRTHTSPVQVRVMESQKPPVRVIVPGKAYRHDPPDATHSPIFHQVEGLLIDRHVTLGDLKGTLTGFARRLFGDERAVRFRPSYFPFTEPSAEMDVSCFICGGGGCRVCKHEGWIEILGCGMVHPRVLEMVGYDPEEVGGFAFGMGPDRIALLKYGIDDIRRFYENDVRLLGQF